MLDTYRRDVAAAPDKSRFVFAYTNLDVAELNRGARDMHRQLGQLGQDHELECADGRLAFAAGDRIQFTETDKKAGIYNGAAGTIKHIENGRVFAELDGSGKTSLSTARQYQSFRHGYAGTIYKGQGRYGRSILSVPLGALALGRELCRHDAAPGESRTVCGEEHRRRS